MIHAPRPLLSVVLTLMLGLASITKLSAAEIVVFALFKDVAVITVDGQRHQLRVGEQSPEGITLISADSEAAVLSVNGKQERYPLGSMASIPLAGNAGAGAPAVAAEVRIYPVNNMYMTVGSINGYTVRFLVDTGATHVAMNENTAKRLGIAYSDQGEPGVAATANGPVRIWEIALDRVKVGGIELLNVRGAVIEGSSPQEVLLGMSFLGRTRMLRDHGVLLLEKKW